MSTTPPCCEQLWFLEPHAVACKSAPMPSPDSGFVRVRSHCSAISAGTEMLVYRGELPQEIALDALLDNMQDRPAYPLQYGYACVGTVEALGEGVAPQWLGRRVFAFTPHASHFLSEPEHLIPLPDSVNFEDAVFLANMETAVNLVQDGRALLGERAVVLGQGIVGLLVTALLARFPLAELIVVDGIDARRELATALGAKHVFEPQQLEAMNVALGAEGADLLFELSGSPLALNLAIDLSGFGSRIVVGSWYGTKSAPIALGGKAHRNRLQISTSQVSSIDPSLSARWDKTRRFEVVWEMLRELRPSKLVSHRVALRDAGLIYKQLHEAPEEFVQALFVYQ